MARVYLAFLGTTDYLTCTYYFPDGTEIPDVRFVQQATVRVCCQDWTEEDSILIFTTDKAYKKNWLDNGHTDREGNILERMGLKHCLQGINQKASINSVIIPEGQTESEIWEIFQILFDHLNSGDQVVFDITHAFRSIPMLAIVVLNYAKVLKQVTLAGIYYGAFESLGSIVEARALPREQRRAPILDLTGFAALLDWGLAIDRFLGAGDAVQVCNLAREEIKPILSDTGGQDRAAAAIRKLANQLETFTKIMATCRGPEITPVIARLKAEIEDCVHLDLIPPLKPLLESLLDHVQPFNGDQIQDGIRAARWCLKHNLIQQGYTILREILVSHFAIIRGVDPQCREARENACRQYLEALNSKEELIKAFKDLSQARNDLNHAGWRQNPMDAQKFGDKLKILIDKIEHHLV